MNEVTRIALSWLSQGIGTMPIQYRDKRPDARALKRAGFTCDDSDLPGRSTWSILQKRLPTEKEIEGFFYSSLINLAVITGGARNLAVIDFDSMSAFVKWFQANPVLTYTVQTSRGMHVYFFSQEPVTARSAPGIDIKANGGYVLAPPSVHPSGFEYQVFNADPIVQVKSIDDLLLPPDLLPALPARPVNPSPEPIRRPVNLDPWEAAERVGEPGFDLIASIKAAFPILSFFPEAERHKSGARWYMARCPLHDDHNPSMWIDPGRGMCGCLAGCNHGRPMDSINLYAALHRLDVRTAILELAEKLRERGRV